MAEKVKMDGKTYDLLGTNDTGTLMTIKEDGWFKKEIQVPTTKVDSIEKDNSGIVAGLVIGAIAITTGIVL